MSAGIGHNSGAMKKGQHGPIVADKLKSYIERVEKLAEERKGINEDISDVYSEAKSHGYDVPTMRRIVALRAQDAADRAEQETLLDTYKHAMGMDKAVAAVQAGASIRTAAKEHGVSKSSLHRALHNPPLVPGKDFDAETGAILENGAAVPAGEKSTTGTGEGADGEGDQPAGSGSVAAQAGDNGGGRPADDAGADQGEAPTRCDQTVDLEDLLKGKEISPEAKPAAVVAPPEAPKEISRDEGAMLIDTINSLPGDDLDDQLAAEPVAEMDDDLDDELPMSLAAKPAADDGDLTITPFLRGSAKR